MENRFKSKRLRKPQIEKIWEKTNEEYFMLGYHWQLYNLIKARPNITVEEICNEMPDFYHCKVSEHNFTNCPAIYEDIDYIMKSCRIDKIIIKDNGSFRLGTEEESIEYANKLYVKAKKLMAKYGAISSKISANGQCKLFGNTLKPTNDSDSKAREYVESFVDRKE